MRVLDMSRVLAGPLAAMTLGDLGADVIKIEEPGRGDETRRWGPPFAASGESAYYLSVNRNKLSVALDLDAADDRRLIRELIAEADVVVENFLPGALARRGLDPDRLLEEFPGLVWCTIGGFAGEPERPGYDFVVQAESGWMSVNGDPAGDPLRAPVAIADVLAGKDAAIAILAVLLDRSRAALPASRRRVRISLLESAVAALVNVAQNVLVSGDDARRWGNGHPNIVPYQLFHASDGDIVVAVGTDEQWRGCTAALGADELAADPALASNAGRLAQRERVVAALALHIGRRAVSDLVAALSARAVPCGQVRTVRDALASVAASALTGVAPSVPGDVRYPPPRLDEHGGAVRKLRWQAFASTLTASSAANYL